MLTMAIGLMTLLLSLPLMAAPLKVMIDPGHGGTDAGAVYGPAKESEITLKVAQQLKGLLEKTSDFKVSLTRNSDQNVSLPERVKSAEKDRADLFISIHANASTDQRARGVEFYFQNHLPPDEESLFLANAENQIVQDTASDETSISKKSDITAILEDLKRHTKMQNSFLLSEKLLDSWGKKDSNAIRQAPFFVISRTNIPSVLIELGFVSNPKESQKLIQPFYQREVAKKIFQGILDYKEMVDKAHLSRLQ